MKELKYIDLFAGGGGLSEGFHRAGFIPVAHVEKDKSACKTLKTRAVYHWLEKNYAKHYYNAYLSDADWTMQELWNYAPDQITKKIIQKEITNENIESIFEQIGAVNDLDLIIGGPPCQSFSIANRNNAKNDDPRNYAYKFYIDFLKKYKPRMFVFENVPGLLSLEKGMFLQQIFSDFRDAGYSARLPRSRSRTLNSKDFGVLQNRKRVIIIGWRNDLNFYYPTFTPVVNKWEVERDLFSDLPKLKAGGGTMHPVDYYPQKKINDYLKWANIRDIFSLLTQHTVRNINKNDREIYMIVIGLRKKGKTLKYSELPENLQTHKINKGFDNRYKCFLGKNNLSNTILANSSKDGNKFIHNSEIRSLSIREMARIQSFPDNYYFEGSYTSILKQIGNAVPVLMAEGIARKIKEQLIK